MKKTFAKKITAIALAFSIMVPGSFGNILNVYGDNQKDLQDAQNKSNELKSQLEETKKTLDSLKNQTSDIENIIASIDSQMAEVDKSLSELESKIDALETEIAETQEQLDQAQEDADSQYEAMKLRIQFMYEHNDETYLSLLLSSKNMGDMLNKAEYISKISEYDRQMLEKYQETVTFIANAKQQLEDDMASLVATQASFQDSRDALTLLENTKNSELQALKKQTSAAQAYSKKLEEDQKKQDDYIASIMEKIRQEEQANNNGVSSGGTKYDGGVFKWPTESTRITSPYGDTADRTSPHKGIDIGALRIGYAGDPIYAAYDGKVVIAQYSSTAGNFIMIYHGNGLYTRYLHCSSLQVSVGQTVSKGQKIALMGTTGNSYGVHLHFDVNLNGQYVNPWNYLSK
ncbi:MAG: peptidoglycan DD-metalloendopeptidase family protein [Lachnospira sp.]|nr:peptidoglycan DD-metalloendopeptidase family protein [Lachnospira sp.]